MPNAPSRSLTVRPYKVVFLMYAPNDPAMEPAELPIETEAFDAADALLQAGVLAEAQTNVFSSVHGVGMAIKTLRVEPNPPPWANETVYTLEATALVGQIVSVPLDAATLDRLGDALRRFVRKVLRDATQPKE